MTEAHRLPEEVATAARRPLRFGLAAMEIPARGLALPVALQALTGFLRILALGLWLPLIHALLAGEMRFGGRFRFLEGIAPAGRSGVAVLVGVILLVTLAKAATAYWGERATAARTRAGERVLAEKIVRRHLRFGQSYFDAVGPGRTVRNVQRLPARAARLVRWLVRTASVGLEITLYALLMVWLAPSLAVIALALLVGYYLGLRRWVDRLEERAGEEEELEDRAAAEIHDLADNLLLLRLSSPEEEAVSSFRQRAERRAALQERREALLGLVDEARQAVNVLLMLGFVLVVGWALQHLDVGAVSRYLVFFLVFRRAMASFSTLQRLPRQGRNVRDRLMEVAELLKPGAGGEVPSGERPLPPVREGLEVRGLTFAYAGGPAVLHDVSLSAPRGVPTVLVGPNGSGKSTLVELVLRLYDVAPGAIFVDGVDVRELDTGSLRRRCAYAGAEPLLLDATLRENLLVGLPGVPEERLEWAVERAGLAPLVAGLEGGLEHPVGSGGLRLSQGERQRVALARVLLRDADVVLLDEALSSFDPEAEAHAMADLVELAADRVVLAVSHRPASIPPGARVVVLEDGRVVEEGLCRDLLARGGPFCRLGEAAPDGRPAAGGRPRLASTRR